MDVSGIASLSVAMANQRTDAALQVAVLKQALELQASTVLSLLEALPVESAAPALPANPNIGRNINIAV